MFWRLHYVYKYHVLHVLQPDRWYRKLCRGGRMVQQRGIYRWLASDLQVRPPSPHRLNGVLMCTGWPSRNRNASLDPAVATCGLHSTGRRAIRPEVCPCRHLLLIAF